MIMKDQIRPAVPPDCLYFLRVVHINCSYGQAPQVCFFAFRQPVPGINSDHVPAAISDTAGIHLVEDQADVRLGQQDEGVDPPEAREEKKPPNRFATQVRSVTLKRVCVTRGLGKNTWMSRMRHDWQSSPSQSFGHMQGQDARRTGEE